MAGKWEDFCGTLEEFEGEDVDATLYGLEDNNTFEFIVVPDSFTVDEYIDECEDIREATIILDFDVEVIVTGLYNYKLAKMLDRRFPSFKSQVLDEKGLTNLDPTKDWLYCYDFDTTAIVDFFNEIQKEYITDFGGKLPPYYELVSEDELGTVLNEAVTDSVNTSTDELEDFDVDEITEMSNFVEFKVWKRAKEYINSTYSTQMWFKLEY